MFKLKGCELMQALKQTRQFVAETKKSGANLIKIYLYKLYFLLLFIYQAKDFFNLS